MNKATLAWNQFWFCQIPSSTLAVLRIAVGGLALISAAILWPDLEPFYHATSLGTVGAQICSSVLSLSAFFLILGFQTRVAAVSVLLSLIILADTNPFIFNSGDTLLRHLALVIAIAPSGLSLSIDQMRTRRHHPTTATFPPHKIWPLRMIQLQITVMYLAAVIHKLGGRSWREGTAAVYPLLIPDVTRYPVSTSLIDTLTIAQIATYGTLALEAAIPLLVWNRRFRPWVLMLGVILHLGIDLTLRAGLFSWIVIASYLAFVPAEKMSSILTKSKLKLQRFIPLAGKLTISIVLLTFSQLQSASATPPANTQEFLQWLQSRPTDVGLTVISPNDQTIQLQHQAKNLFPLGSIRKVLILGAYAQAVARGKLDPAELVLITQFERWYWPGSEGGVHISALEDMRKQGYVKGSGNTAALSIDNLVFCAIRWSDNSAADYLLNRLGSKAVAEFAKQFNLDYKQPLVPILGEQLTWAKFSPDYLGKLSLSQRSRVAWQSARQAKSSDLLEKKLPAEQSLRLLTNLSFAGTPENWAKLLAKIFSGQVVDKALEIIRRHLSWPMTAHRGNKGRFATLAGKGGAMAGLRTNIIYVQPLGKKPFAAALFVRNIDPKTETSLRESDLDQDFLVHLAEDENFLAQARRYFQ